MTKREEVSIRIAAWFEIIVGASFILILNGQSQFIFGAATDGAGVHFARLAGIALISIGIACMPSKIAGTNKTAVRGLLIFNIGVTILFAWVALTTAFRGVILWPVVIVHAVIAIALALSLGSEARQVPATTSR